MFYALQQWNFVQYLNWFTTFVTLLLATVFLYWHIPVLFVDESFTNWWRLKPWHVEWTCLSYSINSFADQAGHRHIHTGLHWGPPTCTLTLLVLKLSFIYISASVSLAERTDAELLRKLCWKKRQGLRGHLCAPNLVRSKSFYKL